MYSKLFKFEAIVKEISGMDAFEAEQAGKFRAAIYLYYNVQK